jgi:hypothetical protein
MSQAAATLSTALAGNNNDLDYTSVALGAEANLLSLTYLAPAAGEALSVSVSGSDITVQLAAGTVATLTTALAGANNDLTFTSVARGVAGNSIKVEYLNDGAAATGNAATTVTVSIAAGVTTISVHLKSSPVLATGTLTSDNTNVSNNDTVTIGSKVYTFKTALTPTEGEVLIGGSADASLLNLIRAINHSGTPNTDYKCAAADPLVTAATSVTAHAFAVTAILGGVAGNAYASTETSAHLSWGGATLAGGSDTNTITATSAQVKTAVDANADAHALVTVANVAANDGTGTVTALASTSLASGSGTSITTIASEVAAAITASVAASKLVTVANKAANDGTGAVIALAKTYFAGGTDNAAVNATGTLTSDNTAPSDGDTVTIGSVTYTFKTTLTAAGVANEVKIGASADVALLNLINAISRNDDGTTKGPGITYGLGTLVHPQVTCAQSVTAHAFLITARTTLTNGTSQRPTTANALATTETSSHLSFGSATLTGGTQGGFDSQTTAVTGKVHRGGYAGDDVVTRAAGQPGVSGNALYDRRGVDAGSTHYESIVIIDGHAYTIACATADGLLRAEKELKTSLAAKGQVNVFA